MWKEVNRFISLHALKNQLNGVVFETDINLFLQFDITLDGRRSFLKFGSRFAVIFTNAPWKVDIDKNLCS